MRPSPIHSSLSPALPLQGHDTVALQQALAVLGAGGDLAMGQPPGASERAGRLALRIARAAGTDAAAGVYASLAARLRWSGAPASAAAHARLLGDDVAGRHGLLARLPLQLPLPRDDDDEAAAIDGDVSGRLAAMMGLPAPVEQALGLGPGMPHALQASAPPIAHAVALASDLEVLARLHGPEAALASVERLGGVRYPAPLAALAREQGQAWLQDDDEDQSPVPLVFLPASVPLALVADALELKLPWLAGFSRRVALLAQRAALHCGLGEAQQRRLVRAALLHGVGRAAVPNRIWERRRRLEGADLEAVRRVPFHTARAIGAIPGLEQEAQLAAQAYERLDGSGYFRGLAGDALDLPQRLLAAAVALVALRSPRPWRAPHAPAATAALLEAQVAGGRLDRDAVQAVRVAARDIARSSELSAPQQPSLSAREIDVLRRLSLGQGHKDIARSLRLSTGAIHDHAERILRQLGCVTREAATLQALAVGLI